MTRRSIPTAAQRAAEQLRGLRTAGALDQGGVAELLTRLGSPTRPSTITRIEVGAQDMTLEQALLLSLHAGRHGLRSLLVPPFTVGTLVVETAADVDALLDGIQLDQSGYAVLAPVQAEAHTRTGAMWDDRRCRSIAETLGTTPRKVANSAQRLYGHTVSAEISARFAARLAELDDEPEPETAKWRAYRSHAVRAVSAEIAGELR